MVDVAGVVAGQVRARYVGSSAAGRCRSRYLESQSRVCSLLASFVRHPVLEVLTKSAARHQCNAPSSRLKKETVVVVVVELMLFLTHTNTLCPVTSMPGDSHNAEW